MTDYFISMAASIILSALKMAVKNPAHKAELQSVMLKIRDSIDAVYGEIKE